MSGKSQRFPCGHQGEPCDDKYMIWYSCWEASDWEAVEVCPVCGAIYLREILEKWRES